MTQDPIDKFLSKYIGSIALVMAGAFFIIMADILWSIK